MSAERDVLAAIVAALRADSAYMALVSGVWDGAVPDDIAAPAFPYTIVGTATELIEGSHDAEGYSHTVMVHDWSLYDGRTEALNIREARNDVLRDAQLSVTGWSSTTVRYEFGEVLREWDEGLSRHVRHGVSRYRVSTLE